MSTNLEYRARERQRKSKRQASEVNKKAYDIQSIKRVTKMFLEVSRCSCAKQQQRNVQKKGAASAKFFFC